jgi:hypothetical protein
MRVQQLRNQIRRLREQVPAPPEPPAPELGPSTPADEERWAALEAALAAAPGPLSEAETEFLERRQMVRGIEEARRESEQNPTGIDVRAEMEAKDKAEAKAAGKEADLP